MRNTGNLRGWRLSAAEAKLLGLKAGPVELSVDQQKIIRQRRQDEYLRRQQKVQMAEPVLNSGVPSDISGLTYVNRQKVIAVLEKCHGLLTDLQLKADIVEVLDWLRVKTIHSIRQAPSLDNHHIFCNNGTWFCGFTVCEKDGSTRRIRQTLKTKDVQEARIRRDRLMEEHDVIEMNLYRL